MVFEEAYPGGLILFNMGAQKILGKVMKDKSLLKSYISNFRRHISASLRPGIGLKATGVLAKNGGVVRFAFSQNSENSDEVLKSVDGVADAFKVLGLNAFGSAEGVVFSGTNTILQPNAIFLIKGEGEDLWSDSAAKEDVHRILHPPRSSK